ncbi:AI-2E family transporter [Microlunatus aurantiacus]|uniref:AI-2E family transporter n=1 Tax=Microlunatus aurantiacus TaxID=446786 RepID=A0ABP7DXR6_9ACTN
MELGKKIRELFGSRSSKDATERALAEASDLADQAAVRQATPRRGLFEGVAPEIPTEVRVTSTAAESDQAVPAALKVAAAWAWRIFLVAGLVYFVGWILGFLSEVAIPLAVASLLAAALKPLANRLHAWGLPKGPAAAVTLLGGILLIAGSLTLIINSIAGQAGELSQQVVRGFGQLEQWLMNSPLPIDQSWFRLDEWGTRIQQFLVDSQSTIAAAAGDIGTSIGHFLAGVAICLFSLFYFLYDGRGIFSFLLNLMPRSAQARADAAALRGWQSLSAYVRATVLVALVDAIGVLIVALALRVPLAPALAALVFLGAFIPLVGAFVSGFVAVLVALVAVGWVQSLIMLAGIIVVMQVEGHILQPFLLGRAVHLHPLAVLLAIAMGIVIAGIVGALLAVPILAFVKTFVQELYRQSHEVVAHEVPPPSTTPPTPPGPLTPAEAATA